MSLQMINRLTPRQQEVNELLLLGESNEEIALCLFIVTNAVKAHVTAIFKAAGVKSRSKYIVQYYQKKLKEQEDFWTQRLATISSEKEVIHMEEQPDPNSLPQSRWPLK